MFYLNIKLKNKELLAFMKNLVGSFLFLILVSGCSTGIDNFDKYVPAPLVESKFLPSKEEVQQKLPIVAVFDFTTFDDSALKAGAADLTQAALKEVVLSDKMAELYNGENPEELRNEVRLAEVSGKPFTGFKTVDYAIDGSIAKVTFTSENREKFGSDNKDIKHTVYDYKATVEGEIKVYEVPSLKMIARLPFRGEALQEEGREYQNLWRMRKLTGDKAFEQNLLREAIKNSFSDNREKIKTFFSRNGFIMEKRVYEGDAIFLITLGKGDGLKAGDKVEVFDLHMEYNSLTGEKEIFSQILTNGIISNKIEEGRSWITITDKENADKIKLGTPVKFTYNH